MAAFSLGVRVIILAALPLEAFMRLSRLSSCLLLLTLAACSSVRVSPTETSREVANVPPPAREDRAATAAFPPADSDGYRPPAALAVLLPMTGSLSAPAAAVRDGFLAAYYAETRRRPTIKFYDTQGTGGGAQAAASRAQAEGAQMIVGPLTRDEVNAVVGNADGSLPIIALNRGGKAPPLGTTSYALLPDEEGAAAASRLLGRGLKSVLVFGNGSDSAQRAIAAARDTLRAGGGDIVAEIPVAGETPDLTARLAALLAAPVPPQAVLLALDAGQARAIAAQLKLSALAGLPRVATSLIVTGANTKADIELEGIEYPELPWLLDQGGGLPDADALAQSLPSARGPSQRLFAFGADAWRLCAWFDRLYSDPGSSIRGATGTLRIDLGGPVRRTPAWAVFRGGRGRPAADLAHSPDAAAAIR
jgi:outer membrane PBP1 activator LpoA protein